MSHTKVFSENLKATLQSLDQYDNLEEYHQSVHELFLACMAVFLKTAVEVGEEEAWKHTFKYLVDEELEGIAQRIRELSYEDIITAVQPI